MTGTQLPFKVKLPNRDGADIWLENIGENVYKLNTNDDSRFYTQYLRIIGDDPCSPISIDPPGGPFISVGDIFDNIKIIDITYPPVLFYIEKV